MLVETLSRFAVAGQPRNDLACMSITWHWALMRRPARVSCTFGVAQAAYKGGVWIVYGG